MATLINFTEDQIDEMVRLHNQKINLRKIGDVFGVSLPTIKKHLLSRGCVIKQRRYDFDVNYFKNIDSEEKAYWLGFLAADGCIRKRVNLSDGKTRGDSIVLKLSIEDEDHLKRFRDSISPQSIITYYTQKGKTRKGSDYVSYSCSVKINSNEIVSDIIRLGVGPKKTFTIDKPNIDKQYIRHYIRGLFDGDGCCHISRKKGKRGYDILTFNYTIASVSEKLVNFLIDELKENGIDSKYRKNGISLYIEGGYLGQKKFFDYMYEGSTIYLKRKYDKGVEGISHFNDLSSNNMIKEYVYNPDVKKPDEVWTEDELTTLIETNDKIPWSYLSGTYIPNKSKSQIERMRKKLGLKARRKIDGYLKMRKEIRGY